MRRAVDSVFRQFLRRRFDTYQASRAGDVGQGGFGYNRRWSLWFALCDRKPSRPATYEGKP